MLHVTRTVFAAAVAVVMMSSSMPVVAGEDDDELGQFGSTVTVTIQNQTDRPMMLSRAEGDFSLQPATIAPGSSGAYVRYVQDGHPRSVVSYDVGNTNLVLNTFWEGGGLSCSFTDRFTSAPPNPTSYKCSFERGEWDDETGYLKEAHFRFSQVCAPFGCGAGEDAIIVRNASTADLRSAGIIDRTLLDKIPPAAMRAGTVWGSTLKPIVGGAQFSYSVDALTNVYIVIERSATGATSHSCDFRNLEGKIITPKIGSCKLSVLDRTVQVLIQ